MTTGNAGLPSLFPTTVARSAGVGLNVAPPKMEGNQLVSGDSFFAQYVAAGQVLSTAGRTQRPIDPALNELLGNWLAEGGSELPPMLSDILAKLQSGELGPVTATPELQSLAAEFHQLLESGDEESIAAFLQQHQLYITPQAELKTFTEGPPSNISVVAQALRGRQETAAQPLPVNPDVAPDSDAIIAQQAQRVAATDIAASQSGRSTVAPEVVTKPVVENPNEYMARSKTTEVSDGKESDVIRQVKLGAMMSQMAQANADSSGGRQPGSGEQQQAWLSGTAALGAGMRPAAASLAPAAAPVMTSIPIPVQDPGWSNALANRVTWMVKDRVQTAEIRLNPERLGPIEVRVELNDDQARVVISSQHAAVRDVIDSSMTRLRDMLNAQGFNLADAQVTDQSLHEHRQRQAKEGEGQAGGGASGDAEELVSEALRHGESVTDDMSAIDYYA